MGYVCYAPKDATVESQVNGFGKVPSKSTKRQHSCPHRPFINLKRSLLDRLTSLNPSEPILLPKLRSYYADFPYLLCPIGPEAANLSHLMRLWVRPGRITQLYVWSAPGFSRVRLAAPDHSKEWMTCAGVKITESPNDLIRQSSREGCPSLLPSTRKENSSRGQGRRLQVCLVSPRTTLLVPVQLRLVQDPWPDSLSGKEEVKWKEQALPSSSPWPQLLAHPLGPTHPCPIDVRMEPLAASAFKRLIWILATITKICTIYNSI